MQTFPMFIKMKDRRVVIAGGGEQAAQKCRLMLKTEAEIIVASPVLDPELQQLATQGRIVWYPSVIHAGVFSQTALVFIATGCPGADAALHDLARGAGALVNVVDQPDLCDALTPSIVDRDPVVVAIGTEGTAPVLARQIKTQVEQMLEPRLGDLATLAGRLRGHAAMRLGPRNRRDLWRWVFSGPVRDMFARGAERAAAQAVKSAIDTGQFGQDQSLSLTLIPVRGTVPDLLTLRAVQRLQEADVVYYDPDINLGLLELARRDAGRVCLGRDWPKERTNGVLANAVKQGQRVVYLSTSMATLTGMDCEVVPSVVGVTPPAIQAVPVA